MRLLTRDLTNILARIMHHAQTFLQVARAGACHRSCHLIVASPLTMQRVWLDLLSSTARQGAIPCRSRPLYIYADRLDRTGDASPKLPTRTRM
jgi:hypothetical protein